MIEQLLAITVGLADSLMVSRVGEAAVSAVSLVDSVNVLLVSAFSSLATGGAVAAGQYLGRREAEKARRSAQQLALFMGECALGITALLYLLKGFILHVVFGSVEPDVAAYADTYFMIVEGNAVLIFGLRMDVAGVAIPTLVSRAVAAALMLALLLRRDLPLHLSRPFSLRHERAMIRNILYIGVPNGIEGSMFQMGKLLLLSAVTVFGTASLAANAIGNTVSTFQSPPSRCWRPSPSAWRW